AGACARAGAAAVIGLGAGSGGFVATWLFFSGSSSESTKPALENLCARLLRTGGDTGGEVAVAVSDAATPCAAFLAAIRSFTLIIFSDLV
ncbi:MAG: hypothetical protein U1E02_28490, partial [Hydrogenophaga sp.]|nr:hypothetical protein [Hydrogenophaga sp.]